MNMRLLRSPWQAILLALSTLVTATSSDCKCTPLDDCWPSEEAWSSLNITLSGALLHPQPPASICYPSEPSCSPSDCENLLSTWHLSTTHLAHPLSISYPLWADPLACPPIFPNGTSLTGDPFAGDRGCKRGNLPEYVVNATDEWHISETLKWAKEKDVRVVIKNTGHNHLGRSTGFGSLSLWTHNLRGVDWHEQWKGGCVEVRGREAQMAVAVGAGEVVGDVIKAAAEHDAIVVTGANPSVGVVGWATGGGHGPLSQTYGFGSDNILSARIITPSGRALTVNECSHPELFYAVRGGGGGSFGVVTSLTFKAFPSPQTTSWELQATLLDGDEDRFWDLMTDFHETLPELRERGLQGYYHVLGPPLSPVLYFGLRFMAFDQPEGAVEAATQRFRVRVEEMKGTIGWQEQIERHGTFAQAYKGDVSKEPVGMGGLALGSRLLPEDVLLDRSHFREVLKAVGPSLDPERTDASPMIIGHAIANADNALLDTALNSAWRNTMTHFLFARGWEDTASAHEIAAVRHDVTFEKMRHLRALAPRSGAYFNEMDAFEPDWQETTWGDKYDRLKAVKAEYDPEGLLWCRHCVGSEGWDEDGEGRLCRQSSSTGEGAPAGNPHDEL